MKNINPLKNAICAAIGFLIFITLTQAAQAGDANFLFILHNSTGKPIYAATTRSCAAIDHDFTNPINDGFESNTLLFRDSGCGGKPGWFDLRFSYDGKNYQLQESFGFQTDGSFWQNGHNAVYINTWSFSQLSGDTYQIHYVLYPDPIGKASVQTAINYGCMTNSDVINTLTSFQTYLTNNPNSAGSQTVNKLPGVINQDYTGRITALAVGQPVWVYRGLTIPGERYFLPLNMYLVPKAWMRPLWNLYGPELTGDADPNALAMRIMAINSSDTPKSQFVSVALSLSVASGFAQYEINSPIAPDEPPSGRYVYVFQIIPNSPILGLNKCILGRGEDQFQVYGGAEIYQHNLYKVNLDTGIFYKYGVNLTGWFQVSDPRPADQRQKTIKKRTKQKRTKKRTKQKSSR